MSATLDKPAAEKFEAWAKIEVMGHRTLAGFVSEVTIAGAAMLRVDVPEVPAGGRWNSEGVPAFTTYLGAGSIYCLTPVTEEIARGLAVSFAAKPVSTYDLPARLPAPIPLKTEDDDDIIDPEF